MVYLVLAVLFIFQVMEKGGGEEIFVHPYIKILKWY
jgi:hypothetical protein